MRDEGRRITTGGGAARPLGRLAKGRFELLRLLGEGSFGAVYEAYDRDRQAVCALKLLHRAEPATVRRFKREFRALADVAHPGLVALHELIADGDRWLFTMERVDGVDLLRWLRGAGGDAGATAASGSRAIAGTLTSTSLGGDEPAHARTGARAPFPPTLAVPLAEAIGALRELVRALGFLHAEELVHCDVKPGNVLVRRATGSVVVLDFGLLTSLDERTREFAGTPVYMAPEQAAIGATLTPACDWYAVGVILHELLTGAPPFSGSTRGVLDAKRRLDPLPITAAAWAPRPLVELTNALLRRNPAERPGLADILRALDEVSPAPAEGGLRPVADEAPQAKFVGRARELGVLRDALAQPGARAVVVRGGAGAGKSALCRHFLAPLDALLLESRCFPRETVPFNAFDGLIEALADALVAMPEAERSRALAGQTGALGRLFPALAPVLPPVAVEPVATELRRLAFAELRALLGHLAAARPILVHVDDLHWIDADSTSLLTELLRPPHPPGIFFLGTCRPDAGPLVEGLARAWGELAIVDLRPLSREATAALVAQLWSEAAAPGAPPDAEEAAGNPFLIQELVEDARRRHGEASRSLQDALRGRLELLPPAAQRALRLIATAGRPVPVDVLVGAMHAGDDVLAALRVLSVGRVTRSVAQRDGLVDTYHDRIREAVLASMAAEELRECHLALAAELEARHGDDRELIGTLLHAGGAHTRALPHLLAAAEHSMATLAFSAAARLYGLAADGVARGGPVEQRIRTARAEALGFAGLGPEAAAEYGRLAGMTDGLEAIGFERLAAEQWLGCGHIDRGLDAIEALLDRVGLRSGKSRAEVFTGLGAARLRLRLRGFGWRERPAAACSPEELLRSDVAWSASVGLALVDPMRSAMIQSRGTRTALELGEPIRVARSLGSEAVFHAAMGTRAAPRIRELLGLIDGLAERTGDPYVTSLVKSTRGITAAQLGRCKEALEHLDEGLDHFRRHLRPSSWELATLNHFLVFALFYRGSIRELCRHVPEGLRDAEARGDLLTATDLRTHYPNLAFLFLDGPEAARAHAEEAERRWSRQGFHAQHYYMALALANIALHEGRPDEALELIDGVWPALRRSLLLMVEGIRIDARFILVRALQGTRARARGLRRRWLGARLAQEIRLLKLEPAPWAHALAALAQAACDDPAAAATHLEQAIVALDAAGMAGMVACARLRLADLLGGDRGAELRSIAGAYLDAEQIAHVERFLALIAPGIGNPM